MNRPAPFLLRAPRLPRALLALAALAGLAWLPAVPAVAASGQLEADLRRCGGEADEHQRLACFDSLVKALPQIRADQFGMTDAIERRRNPVAAAVVARDRAQESLAGTIASLAQGARGEQVFTLDNGQQWIEVEARPGLAFAQGERVTIEHGAMGALWLKAEGRRQVKVRRIQ